MPPYSVSICVSIRVSSQCIFESTCNVTIPIIFGKQTKWKRFSRYLKPYASLCNSHNNFVWKNVFQIDSPINKNVESERPIKNMMMMRLVWLSKVPLCICQISVHGNFCKYFVDCTWFAGCYVTHWYHMFCVFIQYLHCIRTRFHHRNHITPMSNVFQRAHNR